MRAATGALLGKRGLVIVSVLEVLTTGPAFAGSTQIFIPDAPAQIEPYRPIAFLVRVIEGADGFVESSAAVTYSISGGDFVSAPLGRILPGYYFASIPPVPCPGTLDYFVSAQTTLGQTIVDPPLGRTQPNRAQTEVIGLVDLVDVTFTAGALPTGWTASGLWNVTETCQDSPALSDGEACVPNGGSSYYGVPGQCTYDTGFRSFGVLASPSIQLPKVGPSDELFLEYCMRKITENDPKFDVATLLLNGTIADQPPDNPAWTRRTIDLVELSGTSIALRFQFDTVDDVDNDYLGWQIDHLRIRTVGTTCPNRRADMNCDGLVDFNDLPGFVSALVGPEAYAADFPNCDYFLGDLTGDSLVAFDDINDFVACLSAAGICP